MRSTIETYKESLSRIASDVLDNDEELEEVLGSRSQRRESSSLQERRLSSRRFSRLMSPAGSPVPNGVDSVASSEVDLRRDDIRRLQASEAEVKAPISYIAMLKEKEAQLSRLHEENNSLKRSLEAKNATAHVLGEGNPKAFKNNSIANKEAVNQSPNKQNCHSIQPFSIGNGVQKENVQQQDIFGHGNTQATLAESQQDIAMEHECVPSSEKELLSVIQVNSNAFVEVRANLESEIKHLKAQLEHEREISSDLKLKFQDVYDLNETSKNEIKCMKLENERTLIEMKEMQKQFEAKNSEIKQLQLELSRIHSHANSDDSLENLRKANEALRKENATLKVEKDKVESAMELSVRSSLGKFEVSRPQVSCKDANSAEKEKEELLSIQRLEKTLKDTYKERDKAQRELARLKQHLLDKENEESDKMDEDSKIIEELKRKFEHQKGHILKLEKALKNEVAKREEIKNFQSDELQKLNEINKDLKQKLANSLSLVDSKNVELLNLQTALGQYYAESEAKERLERNLASAREESTNLSKLLEIVKLDLEKSNKDKEELLSKLLHTEMMLSDAKLLVKKLQEDNAKLHRAVEQSMTRLNRMSMDSDFYVDRRIVTKLLVTYFQRNHSKEVLDLMVRMLGFSDEDKRRIGFAQQAAGKTVVRGVLGLPGRLVGGILGGGSHEGSPDVPSENQSFADLWVDFLLKDAEQREKQEKANAEGTSSSTQEKSSTKSGVISSPGTMTTVTTPTFTTSFPTVNSSYSAQFSSPLSKQSLSETDAEFANVPLTSSVSPRSGNSSRYSRLLPKYWH